MFVNTLQYTYKLLLTNMNFTFILIYTIVMPSFENNLKGISVISFLTIMVINLSKNITVEDLNNNHVVYLKVKVL